jgi:acid phosphatase
MWPLRTVSILFLLLFAVACGGQGLTSGPPDGRPTGVSASPSRPAGSLSSLGASAHTWLIVLENHDYDEIVGSSAAPFFDGLAARFGLLTNAFAVAHPSQPNYLALWSGSTQGVHDDGVHTFSEPTLADQLEKVGLDWRVFAENVPDGCFTGASASDGPDGSGRYARKHEPAIDFSGVQDDPGRCARIQAFQAFAPDAAPFELIVPNLCHDMHDCDTAAGDAWLASFVPQILSSQAWKSGGLLLVTFDEGKGNGPTTPSHVATLAIAPWIAPGTQFADRIDHYGVLATIEARFGLGCLAQACSSAPYGALLGR